MSFTVHDSTDLFSLKVDALAHGCNMKGLMGHGIAVQFKKRYPAMHKAYKEYCDKLKAIGAQPGGYFFWDATEEQLPHVYNLFTQVRPGKDARLVSCEMAFAAMLANADDVGITSIGIPAIASDIGGLKWADVKAVLLKAISYTETKAHVHVAFLGTEKDFLDNQKEATTNKA